MTAKDKREMIDIFNQGVTDVIIPVLDKMATKKDLDELKKEMKNDMKDIQTQLDSIERKVTAEQSRTDQLEKGLKSIKSNLSFA